MATLITRYALTGAQATLQSLHSPAMRRWLAIFLMLLLPLQFSWAAVANYCGHETDAVADYVGHHGHATHDHGSKVADAGDIAKTDGSSTPASGVDCGHCHGYCVCLIDLPSSVQPLPLGVAPSHLGDAPAAEHIPAQPERPQWGSLA
jgi:hypothetical protein